MNSTLPTGLPNKSDLDTKALLPLAHRARSKIAVEAASRHKDITHRKTHADNALYYFTEAVALATENIILVG